MTACEKCGRPIAIRSIDVLGLHRQFAVACPCRANEPSRLETTTLESLASVVDAHSSVPARFRDATFEGVLKGPRAQLERALLGLPDLRKRWHEPNLREGIARIHVRGRGVALWGGNGSGKSYAMGAFLRAARERLIPGLFVPATQLQLAIEKSERYGPGDAKLDLVQRYARAALLVIDDFDKLVATTSSIATALYELIDARLREDRPLFLTTNLEPAAMTDAVFGKFEKHAAGVADRWFDLVTWVKYDRLTRRMPSA